MAIQLERNNKLVSSSALICITDHCRHYLGNALSEISTAKGV